MSVLIGHASLGEDKKVSGGKLGDNTGKEVCTRSYYVYKGGWTCLIRPKTSTLAENEARMCELGCSNNNIGYDQGNRNSLFNLFKKCYDISKVGLCETDCSAFMTVCAIGGGANIPYGTNAPTTRTMRIVFMNTGQYEILTDNKYLTSDKYLKRGDILVAEGHHTVMVLSNGENVGKSGEETYSMPTKNVTSKKQAKAKNCTSYISSGNGVKWVQYHLSRYSTEFAKVINNSGGIDGSCGDATVFLIGVFQDSVGLEADGIAGKNTVAELSKY